MKSPSPGFNGDQRRHPEVLLRPDVRQNGFRNVLDLQSHLDLLLKRAGWKVDLGNIQQNCDGVKGISQRDQIFSKFYHLVEILKS